MKMQAANNVTITLTLTETEATMLKHICYDPSEARGPETPDILSFRNRLRWALVHTMAPLQQEKHAATELPEDDLLRYGIDR